MKHAVLYQDEEQQYMLLLPNRATVSPYGVVASVENLYITMVNQDIDVLWVMPDTEFSHVGVEFFGAVNTEEWSMWWPGYEQQKTGETWWVAFYKRIKGEWVSTKHISFPANTTLNGNWCSDSLNRGHWISNTPYDMLDTVQYVCRVIDSNFMQISPGNAGMKLLTVLNAESEIEQNEHPFPLSYTAQMVESYEWVRELTIEEQSMIYVHCFDKNGQFNGAASNIRYGVGTPVHVKGDVFNKKLVGFWHYRILDMNGTEYNNQLLPCPLDTIKHFASTDLIQCALDLGVHVEIVEGWMWEKSYLYMRKFAKMMWDARTMTAQPSDDFPNEIARVNAHYTFKQISNATIGRFGSDRSKQWHRPDYRHLVEQGARNNITRTVEKYRRDAQVYPFLVKLDTIVVASNEPDPMKAVPGILQYQTEQRGYHHERTVLLDQEIIEACHSTHSALAKSVIYSKESVSCQNVAVSSGV